MVFRDKPAGALDDRGATAVVGADDRAQISGSRRAESAVEPTKSQNITVSCRHSASGDGAAAARGTSEGYSARSDGWSAYPQRFDRIKELAAITDHGDADVLQIPRRKLREDLGVAATPLRPSGPLSSNRFCTPKP
jgi:hypothetical protein